MENFGWTPNFDKIEEYKAGLNPVYGDQLQELITTDDNQDVYLWRPLTYLIKRNTQLSKIWLKDNRLVAYFQKIGDCVGNSDALCWSLEAAIDIVVRKEPEEFKYMCSAEACYALGREAGNMLGRGDGSYGSAQAKADITMGTLWMTKYDGVDLSTYSGARASSWGASGVPNNLKPIALQTKLKQSYAVKNADEAWTIIGLNKRPIQMCSNVGWESTKDKTGFCKQSGSWSHALCLCARRTLNGEKQLMVRNSWGDYNYEQVAPVPFDCPRGAFWASFDSVDKAIKQGDSFTKIDVDGFKRVSLNWENVW
jgi:hypothetical protein